MIKGNSYFHRCERHLRVIKNIEGLHKCRFWRLHLDPQHYFYFLTFSYRQPSNENVLIVGLGARDLIK